jgi:hypothetical protein
MSIATDEAEKYFPTQYWPGMEPNGDYLGKECYIESVKSSDIQEAYEQGRTAEPTEAEIEAAAIAAYKYYFDSRGNSITLEIAKHDVQRFNGSTDEFSDPDVNYARNIATAVLTAARKAVTGDERGY